MWSPYKLADVKKLESIQRKFTKRLSGLHELSYQDRLSELGAESLQTRRIKFDLTMYFKIMHNLVDLDHNKFFEIKSSRTRGNDLALRLHKYCSNIDRYSFKNRLIALWNLLPNTTVNSSSLGSFKENLKSLNMSSLVLKSNCSHEINWL